MKGLTFLNALVGVLLIPALAGAGGGYTTEQVKRMSSAGSGHNEALPPAKVVPVTEVLAAAQKPGADVEGSIDNPNVCWYQGGDQLWTWWGTPPYRQWVRESRYWCANGYGHPQTYRVSGNHSESLLCDVSQRYAERVSGGNGYTWTTVQAGARFSCPTPIPWVTFNYNRWQEYACNTWGNCAFVRQSGG